MNKMYFILALSFLLLSCNKDAKSVSVSKKLALAVVKNDNDGLVLLKSKCYACHSVTTKSHDAIIAPPMIAVKKHYTYKYDNEKDFVAAIVNFVSNPKEDIALMHGAVNRFKLMPKAGFLKEDITKIATYIYNNELEKPMWFKAHQEEMQNSKKMKSHSGNGCGKNCGKRCKGH